MTQVKICGLRDQAAMDACAGADFVGLNFCPASPRFVTPEVATGLRAPAGAVRVGLFVDPSDAEIEAALGAIETIQLHGRESAGRAREIRARFGLPVIKAVTVKGREDLEAAQAYEGVADWLLLDGSAGGGQGVALDWALLEGFAPKIPWMLAGGLTPENVARAIARARIALVHPGAVDVSSGVESARGVKDPALIRRFIKGRILGV